MKDWVEYVKRHRWMYALFAGQIALLMLLCVRIYLINKSMTILSPHISYWQSRYVPFENNEWSMDESVAPSDAEFDDFDFLYGPYLSLPKGCYCVNIEYICDKTQRIDVHSYNFLDEVHQFERENLDRNANKASFHFYLSSDADDLEVRVKYNGEGNLAVSNIYISQTSFYHKIALILLLFCFILMDLLILGAQEETVSADMVNNISKYRSIIMAIAILLVMVYHGGFDFENHEILKKVKQFGYCGVDFFCFLTGVGCYFSYLKDKNPANYMKRRMLRIMPVYYLCVIPWIIFRVIKHNMPFESVIGNLFFVEIFRGPDHCFNWYVTAMWIFYFLAPFLVILVEEKINSVLSAMGLVILSFVATIPFWEQYYLIIIFARIPILILGIVYAKIISGKIHFAKIAGEAALACCSVIGFVWLAFMNRYLPETVRHKGFNYYPFVLIVPGVAALIGYIASKLDMTKLGGRIVKYMGYLGGATFEAYLLHIIVFDVVKVDGFSKNVSSTVLIILLSILSVALRRIVQRTLNGFNEIRKKPLN